MKCRNCGTEIAEKAIVCYRCGTATTEPTIKPPDGGLGLGRSRGRPRSSASLVASILALLLLGGFAVYMTRTFVPGNAGTFSWIVIVFAVVIVGLRGFARRMRR